MQLKLFSFFSRFSADPANSDRIQLSADEKKNFERQYLVNLIDQEWEVLGDKAIWKDIQDAILFIAESSFNSSINSII